MLLLRYLTSVFTLVDTFRFSCVFTAVLLLTRYVLRSKKQTIRLPPGPKGLPVVGNILQLGPNPHLTMTNFAKKFGAVYRLKLGSRMVIVVNGMDAIKQALLRQPMDFVSRPEMHTTQYVCRGHSIVFGAMPVDEHRRYRKLIVDALGTYALRKVNNDQNNNSQSVKASPVVERIVTEEVSDLAQRLLKSELDSGHEVHGVTEDRKNMTGIFNEIAWTTSNIMSAFLFGERYQPGDSHIKFIIDNNNDFSRIQANSSAADMMPWTRYVIPGLLTKFKAVIKKFDDFMQEHIKKHVENFDNIYDWNKNNKTHVEPKNVLDGLIATARLNRGNPLYDEKHTLNTIVDLMGAGFDTISKSLMWIFVYSAVFKDAQEIIRREIDTFIHKEDRPPKYADRNHFPYTNAFIHEVLRHSSFVPFTIPHAVTRDNVRLLGYDMPKGTIVFINQWSVNYDVSVWKSPEHFRPERFLDADGMFQPEVGDRVLLFGMGRRACPGKVLAKLEMFLYITQILRVCNLSMHPDHPGLPKTEYGLTMRPETGKMMVEPR
ncbi:cytochrome P450 1A4-like [Styela clava]